MSVKYRIAPIVSAAAVVLFASASPARGQDAVRDTPSRISPAGTASITGIVVAAGETTQTPIRKALVTVTGTGISTFVQAVTDDQGRFVFAGLPAGRFSLTAEKPAYVKSYYGSARLGRPPGMPIAVGEGQRIPDVRIAMARGAAVSGRVLDEAGTPVASSQVQVFAVAIVNGERRTSTPVNGMSQVTTDDRGAYRAYGLAPGEYVVRAVGGGGFSAGGTARMVTADELERALRPPVAGAAPAPAAPAPLYSRAPTYYPNVTEISAAPTVVLAAGDDRRDITITSRLARVARIDGTAIGPDGQPASNISVGVANVSAGSVWSSLGAVQADAAGRFFVQALTPGRWMLFGRAAPPGTPSDGEYPWWAQTEFVVGDQDLSGVVLAFAPGSAVKGRITFNGSSAPLDATRLRVTLTPLPAIPGTGLGVSAATPLADGTFTIPSVQSGRYRITMSAAGNWSLQSAVAGGRESLDTPLEVLAGQDTSVTLTMTDQPTEISGVLIDQLGRPAPEYSVIVFSANRLHWGTAPRRTSGVVKVGSDGGYRVTGLPPGNYVLCVVTDIEPGSLTDPTFLEELARVGIPIALTEGEKRRQDFKIGTGDPNLYSVHARRHPVP
ncbi:MAG TPA: carboxypeptidase-like regulatory domain-containing protein [Vicinamibacterales bacterium]|nr:carboxypeptidase-like regulatory domain-containing protein [Vicinamibacterales bacterium]